MNTPSRPDPELKDALEALPESAWTIGEVTDDYIRSYANLDIKGRMTEVWRTQYIADDHLQKVNTHQFNESEGKRWGDGQVVGRIPLNVLYDPNNQLVEKMREGDKDHLKWWLNSEQARPFRTFKGNV